MRVLLDKIAPYGLIRHLEHHTVSTADSLGWGRLENGELLTVAEQAGFDVFLTADKKIRYQQNLRSRKIAVVVLGHSPWPLVRLCVTEIVLAVDSAQPGSYAEVEVPLPARRPFTH
jgi:hypothetical protein